MDDKNKKNLEENQNTPKPRARRTRKPRAAQTEKSNEAKSEETKAQTTDSENKVTTLKDSIALLEEIGYKKVSNQTFINERDLEAFLHQDFTGINKTKALGFIKILEREYPVDLSELRAAYIAYFREHKPEEPETLFLQSKEEDSDIWKKYLLWALIPIVIGGLLWYLFGKSDDTLDTLKATDKVLVHDINSDAVKKAEQNLLKLEVNDAQKEPAKTAFSSENNMAESNLSNSIDTNSGNADEDLDLDAVVKQMIREHNITVNAEDTNITESPEAKTEETAVVSKPEAPKTAKVEKAKVEKKIASKVSKNRHIKQEGTVNSKLFIKPAKRAWVGIIYLDDYTKKDFLIKSVFKLNAKRPQLIVVGHKFFEIFNNGYSYRFRARGPVRFIYKDGEIMEINKNEFTKYSKGVNW